MRAPNLIKVSKGAKIRNRYNQVPHLNQDTNGKVTNSQLDFTSESQEVSPFPGGATRPGGGHKAHINRRVKGIANTRQKKKHKMQLDFLLTVFMCNLTTGSVNSVRKLLIYTVFMKIRSMSPKSNQLFPPSQQCSHASLLIILPLVQKITHGNPILDISKCRCHLVDRSRSPKSNKLLTLFQQCTHLCKFGQNTSTVSEDNARKRGYADADANVDEIRIKNNMSTLPSVGRT